MFARIKKSGAHQYLQIVENRREGQKTIQRVIATIGRMDHLQDRGEIENLVRSLSRFSEKSPSGPLWPGGRAGLGQEDRPGPDL